MRSYACAAAPRRAGEQCGARVHFPLTRMFAPPPCLRCFVALDLNVVRVKAGVGVVDYDRAFLPARRSSSRAQDPRYRARVHSLGNRRNISRRCERLDESLGQHITFRHADRRGGYQHRLSRIELFRHFRCRPACSSGNVNLSLSLSHIYTLSLTIS